MSHVATNWAFSLRGLKPSAKIVLLVLADCHNPVYGCFPTQAFLAEACEMSRDTVNVQLANLEAAGLIRRERSVDPVSKRQRPTRYKLAFEADFEDGGVDENGGRNGGRVAASGKGIVPARKVRKAVSENPTQTEKAVSDSPGEPCRNYGESRVGNSDTNLVREPVTEPCVGGDCAAHIAESFERFWQTHPRPRDLLRARRLFLAAVSAGVDAERIVEAAQRYRAENAGNKAQYIAYADNWLDQRRWEDHQNAKPVVARSDAVRNAALFWAEKVKAGAYIPQSAISQEVAACMIRGGLVQERDLLRAGLRL